MRGMHDISRYTLEKHSRDALSRYTLEKHSRDALSRVYLMYVRVSHQLARRQNAALVARNARGVREMAPFKVTTRCVHSRPACASDTTLIHCTRRNPQEGEDTGDTDEEFDIGGENVGGGHFSLTTNFLPHAIKHNLSTAGTTHFTTPPCPNTLTKFSSGGQVPACASATPTRRTPTCCGLCGKTTSFARSAPSTE